MLKPTEATAFTDFIQGKLRAGERLETVDAFANWVHGTPTQAQVRAAFQTSAFHSLWQDFITREPGACARR